MNPQCAFCAHHRPHEKGPCAAGFITVPQDCPRQKIDTEKTARFLSAMKRGYRSAKRRSGVACLLLVLAGVLAASAVFWGFPVAGGFGCVAVAGLAIWIDR